MNAIVQVESNAAAYRASTDAASLCREIVMQTAKNIGGRKYVAVEGWEAIAIAHGCAASALDVERVLDEGASGFKCVGVVRRMSDGQEISRGEGFLGDDEQTWAKRAVYARRAMTQTRAISRACRSAFAHVVVMIDKNLATTPAEEVPSDGFDNGNVIDATAEPKIPGIHKIKERLRAMMTAGDDPAITLDGFRDLKRANKDDLKTIRDANHSWWTGDGEDFEGFGPWIERRSAELDTDSASNLAIDQMKQCEDRMQLERWMEANAAYLETLDGEESRRFQAAYDEFEAGLAAVANVRAG